MSRPRTRQPKNLIFDFVSTDMNVWGKKRALGRLLKRRGLAVCETAYVGDEIRDIEATRALKLQVIAVSWGYTLAEQLSIGKPDHLIDHPFQLFEVLIRGTAGASNLPLR